MGTGRKKGGSKRASRKESAKAQRSEDQGRRLGPTDRQKVRDAMNGMQRSQANLGVMRAAYRRQEQEAIEQITKAEEHMHYVTSVLRDKLEIPDKWLLDLSELKFVPPPAPRPVPPPPDPPSSEVE